MSRHKGDVTHGAGVDTPEPPAGAGAKSGQTPSGESNEDIIQITPVGRLFLPRTYHACTVHPGAFLLESHPHYAPNQFSRNLRGAALHMTLVGFVLQRRQGLQKIRGSQEPCDSVDDFLDSYGLWEIKDRFKYHRSLLSSVSFCPGLLFGPEASVDTSVRRIDDMEIILRLSNDRIALISDRVGIQVLLCLC
jgi:hypothetical protein